MKHWLMLCLASILFSPVLAQEITPDKMMDVNSDIRNKLVELALQNPELEVADHQVNVAKYNLSAAKGWWAENFTLSFNANEYSIKNMGKSSTTDVGHFYSPYPLYNMGINIPIGGIFSKPQAVKAAREQVAIMEADRTGTYRQIRASVLSAYEDYLSSRELLTVQSQVTESAYNEFLQARQKFGNGQISLESYNNIAQQYHNQLMVRINAEHDLNINKIKLESIIGVPLSNVLPNVGKVTQATSDSTTIH